MVSTMIGTTNRSRTTASAAPTPKSRKTNASLKNNRENIYSDWLLERNRNPELFLGNEFDLVFGMIGALLAAAVWLQIASYFGWPVSTTHSIVGAVLGFGVMYGGMHAADWAKVGSIAASWVISPLLSGSISYLIFSIIRKLVFYSEDPVRVAKKMTPYLVFLVRNMVLDEFFEHRNLVH